MGVRMNKIKKFWLQSYHSDKIAFYFELISFIFTVGASMTLALTADQPDMRIVYPGFFIGSLTATYAHYRRELAWPMILVGYFSIMNVFGFGVANGWW
jgi:hypothetical protein